MGETESDTVFESAASVTRWRVQTLREAGYPDEEALVLAGRDDVDLHVAVSLLEQGCDVKTALKILL